MKLTITVREEAKASTSEDAPPPRKELAQVVIVGDASVVENILDGMKKTAKEKKYELS